MKHVELNNTGTVITVRSAPYPPAAPRTIEAPEEVECGWRLESGEWIETPEAVEDKRIRTYGPCEAYQLRTWMVRQGLSLVAREEALVRWEYAIRIPRDHPLVNLVAASLQITPAQIDEAWPTILAI